MIEALLLGGGGIAVVMGEVAEEPDDDRGYEDDAGHLVQILLAFLPGVAEDGLGGRDSVGREFHDEGQVVVLDEAAHHLGRDDGHDDEHGDQAALVVLDSTGGHNGGYVAAEAHDHGYERLAVQAYLVHELVHDEGGAGHVSGVLQQGNEQVENQDVGQEYQHAAHSSDDAVHYQVLQHALRHGGGPVHYQVLQHALRHGGGHEGPEFLHQPFNPGHRVFSQAEGGLEDDVQQEDEYREGGPAVGDHGVYLVGYGMFLSRVPRSVCLFEGALDEGVFGVYDGGLGTGASEQSLYAPVLLEGSRGT